MENKVVLFAFRDDPMCFVHVLLYALDYEDKGWEAKIVVEGAAAKLIPELAKEGAPRHSVYKKVLDKGLFAGACKACSQAMKVLDEVQAAGLELLDDMAGHPSMSRFQEQGYTVVTF
ncbi:MAG: cytoplasmic protein [Desulfatibacillum sp.]|nr:cytoplasmic protein [Desulfatibacillum sp.]